MAALNFPSSPAVNDTYTVSGGPTWTWNGESWLATGVNTVESFVVPCSDLVTGLTAGTNKFAWRMPYAFVPTEVYGELRTAQTSGSIFTVDLNEAGTSILSTKITIDNGETDSDSAVAAVVISDTSLARRALMSIDIDQIGDGTAKGLIITMVGRRP